MYTSIYNCSPAPGPCLQCKSGVLGFSSAVLPVGQLKKRLQRTHNVLSRNIKIVHFIFYVSKKTCSVLNRRIYCLDEDPDYPLQKRVTYLETLALPRPRNINKMSQPAFLQM